MSAGIGVIHTAPKSGGKKVTLFGSNCYDGVSAGVGVIYRSSYESLSYAQRIVDVAYTSKGILK